MYVGPMYSREMQSHPHPIPEKVICAAKVSTMDIYDYEILHYTENRYVD